MKSKRYFFIICILPIVLTILTCDRINNPLGLIEKMPGKDVIIPLNIGNIWTYEFYACKNNKPYKLQFEYSYRILDTIKVNFNNEEYLVAVRQQFDKETFVGNDYKWLEWNGENGLYSMGGISSVDTMICKYLELKYPVSVGDNWEVPRITYTAPSPSQGFTFEDTLTYSCVAIDSLCETPAGNFNCVVYHYRRRVYKDIRQISDFYLYYKPRIGLVAFERKDEGKLKDLVLLKSYSFKN